VKTYTAKAADVKRDWYVVDAAGKTLGRLASEIAQVLAGKRKPIYTPHVDCGDFVIVLNASKIHVTGHKLDQEFYARHSGYPGGFRSVTMREQMETHPDRVITLAVRRMLPKNRLGRAMIKKLKVYADASHPHQAQQPKPLELP